MNSLPMTEEKRRYRRSVSQLKTLTRCGEQFRLTRMIRPKLPPRPAPWTMLGNALHEAFVEWERSGREIDVVARFTELYDFEVEEGTREQPDLSLWQLPPNTKSVSSGINNYRKRGIEKDVPLYRQRCLEAEWEVMQLPDGNPALELEFELDLDGVLVPGYIDRIQWWPKLKMAAIEDTKTGSNKTDHDVRQLVLYGLAAQEVYDIDLTHGRYWYTKLDKPGAWHDLRKFDRAYLSDQYRKLDEVVDQGLLLPNPGDHCKLCEVKPYCSELGWMEVPEE